MYAFVEAWMSVPVSCTHILLAFPHFYSLYRDIFLHYFQYKFQKQ